MKSVLLGILVLLCVDLEVKSDPYGVIFKLQELVKLENILTKKMLVFVTKILKTVREDEISPEVIRLMAVAERRNTMATELPLYIGSPIHAFHLLHRAVRDWDTMSELMTCHELDCPDLTGADIIDMHRTRHKRDWPNVKDLSDYTSSLLKLWKIYQINIDPLMIGKLLGVEGEPLTFDDLLFIASVARDKEWHYEAIQWYNTALTLTETDVQYKKKLSRVYRPLAAAYDKSKMTWKAIDLMETLLEHEPDNAGAQRDLKHYKSLSQRNSIKKLEAPKKRYANLKDRPTANYDALCRGEMKSERNLSRLVCILEKKMIPYAPLKAEIRNENPRIVLYHDLLSPKDLNSLLKSAEVVLRHPERNGYTDFKKPSEGVTHAHSVWLNNIITRNKIVSHKIEDILGMSSIIRRSDVINTFQVTNFAPGSHFLPYWEADEDEARADLEEMPQKVVKRYANVKIFLSDVEGGATVFPYAKARIPVIKGGVAVWIHDRTDDITMRKTLSADCPVLTGFKWAATKWMHPIGIDMTAVPISSRR